MTKHFTLEYWKNNGWFVGRIKKSLVFLVRGNHLKNWKKM